MSIDKANDPDVVYRVCPAVSNYQLNRLFGSSWDNHDIIDFRPILERSLAFVCAYHSDQLIGFVNIAWDGGIHAFILDTTVHQEFRRRGIGVRLVEKAAKVAKERNIAWLHVDYEPHLQSFYDKCGFTITAAGLINLKHDDKHGRSIG